MVLYTCYVYFYCYIVYIISYSCGFIVHRVYVKLISNMITLFIMHLIQFNYTCFVYFVSYFVCIIVTNINRFIRYFAQIAACCCYVALYSIVLLIIYCVYLFLATNVVLITTYEYLAYCQIVFNCICLLF